MEMKKVFEQEGRNARNLLAYQISSIDLHQKCDYRKPPVPKIPTKKIFRSRPTTSASTSTSTSTPRIRSASTGPRDKRSELQARYWALLFGNLQRAINEIYQTVECYENLSSCQEAILVLENYIRDFKALAEWFRMSWDYESTTNRPQSLAWDVRKSNPAPPMRAKSLSSSSPPITSGKSSPCPSFSGKSSPCSTTEENVKSQYKKLKGLIGVTGETISNKCELKSKSPSNQVCLSPRLSGRHVRNVQVTQPNHQQDNSRPNNDGAPKIAVEQNVNQSSQNETINWNQIIELENENAVNQSVDLSQSNSDQQVDKKSDQFSQTDLDDDNLTLEQWRDKYERNSEIIVCNVEAPVSNVHEKITTPLDITVDRLNRMEDCFLLKQIAETKKPFENNEEKIIQLNKPAEVKKVTLTAFPMKYSSVLNRNVNVVKSTSAPSSLKTVLPIRNNVRVRSQQLSKCSTSPAISAISEVKRTTFRSSTVQNIPKTGLSSKLVTTVEQKRPENVSKRRENIVPSNVANRLSARSKTMIDISNRNSKQIRSAQMISKQPSKDCDVSSSSSTLKASIERVSSSSSIPGSNKNLNQVIRTETQDRRSEPKSMLKTDENDGWLTVKARRRSSLHWANRFNQPTGYASLPSLALESVDLLQVNELNEAKAAKVSSTQAKKENKKTAKTEKLPVDQKQKFDAKSKHQSSSVGAPTMYEKPKLSAVAKNQTVKNITSQKPVPKLPLKPSKSLEKNVNATKSSISRENIIQRQKSDLTGLKITSLYREYLRKEKINYREQQKILSSSSSSSSILSVSPKEIVESSGCHSLTELCNTSVDMKIQTNMGLSKTISDLYYANQGGQEDFSSDEIEDRDDIESDEDQRKLFEEQENLERQIRELENTEIDVDTETDETDCDVILGLEENDNTDYSFPNGDENMSLEMRYQSLLSDMSVGERDETLATLQAIVSRHPGRAQELHQKLSSPSRRRSLHETLKKYQVKQARAHDKREALNKEKAVKIQTLLARVEDVKAAKQQLIDDKRMRMEKRLQKAEDNRNQYLKDKVRKAHDEEEKLKEIAFIKSLERENKRLDFIESWKEQEGRLQDLEQERQKRVEEKAAKEAAVERRRLELELERKKKLEKMDETRREREQRIGQMQEQKEKIRQQMARDKARDREERLQALQAQQLQKTEELQRKIIQNQQESARRHEENIEQIRQRAVELSIPSRNTDENGQRIDGLDRSDGGDLSSVVSDVSREQLSKASKKKFKKLKQRMALRTEEYMAEMQQVPGYMKRDSEVPKLLGIIKKGGGTQGIERQLGQLQRVLTKAQVFDFQCFWLLDGLGVLAQVIRDGMNPNSELSRRATILAVQTYRNACSPCPQISRHAVLANSITIICDVLVQSLQIPDEKTPSHPVELSTELMLCCTVALSPSKSLKQTHPKVVERLPDLISYIVSIGLVDLLTRRCLKIRDVVESHQCVVLSLLATLGLLTKIGELCPKAPDTTKFLASIKSTDLFGTISLLSSTIVPVGECIPPRTISLAAATFNLLVTVANLDLLTFQAVLGDESLSFQFFDVIITLLTYCGPKSTEKNETQAVVIDLVATLGFYCANNKENQNRLTSEQSSLIIKNLAKLPSQFEIVVYPTLITIITDNPEAQEVIGREFDLKFLEDYRKSDLGKKNMLVSLIKSTESNEICKKKIKTKH